MRFSREEKSIAKKLAVHKLNWQPQAGNYVWDESGICERTSPFDDRVFFILNYDYFMRMIGGVERFKKVMVWLPTWEDCREILSSRGVTDKEILQCLTEARVWEAKNERMVLYNLILKQFVDGSSDILQTC